MSQFERTSRKGTGQLEEIQSTERGGVTSSSNAREDTSAQISSRKFPFRFELGNFQEIPFFSFFMFEYMCLVLLKEAKVTRIACVYLQNDQRVRMLMFREQLRIQNIKNPEEEREKLRRKSLALT